MWARGGVQGLESWGRESVHQRMPVRKEFEKLVHVILKFSNSASGRTASQTLERHSSGKIDPRVARSTFSREI